MSADIIQRIICKMEVMRFNLPCENVKYLFSNWEADVLSINKNNYLTEFEVKISYSDFKADFKKIKHYPLKNRQGSIPNRFYYVCPDGLIPIVEIPEYAGLIYIVNEQAVAIKKAPLLHNRPRNREEVLQKFLRIMTEREYIGMCRLTLKNKLIMEKYERNNSALNEPTYEAINSGTVSLTERIK